MYVKKHAEVSIEKADDGRYDARFVMSAIAPDRVKDTIEPSAYLPNMGKKVIALWQHDHDKPIGFWENLRLVAGQLIGDIKFATTPLARMAKALIDDGVPLGASIGFRGRGEPNKSGGFHYKELELLECSVVSVPCHPAAMQIAKSFGFNLDSLEGNPRAVSGASEKARSRAALAIIAAKRTLKGK